MSVQTEIDRLASAKSAIGTAITGKGVTVPSETTLDGYAALVDSIAAGVDTSDATATANDIASGETAYVNGEKVTGELPVKSKFGFTNLVPKFDSESEWIVYEVTSTGERCILERTRTISLKGPAEEFGNATASDVAEGKTFTSAAGLKVKGTYTGSGSAGLAMASGTTTSSTIRTGLSSISCIVIYKTSFSETGLIQGVYTADSGSAEYVYCSSYSSYYKTCATGSNSSSTVDGGTFTWGGSNTSGLSSDKTYNWIAFGAA